MDEPPAQGGQDLSSPTSTPFSDVYDPPPVSPVASPAPVYYIDSFIVYLWSYFKSYERFPHPVIWSGRGR